MRSNILVVAIVSALIAMACRHTPESGSAGTGTADPGASVGSPSRPLAELVQITPSDLTTGAGTTSIDVVVSNWGDALGGELLGKLGHSLSLRTWPELTVVPTASGAVDADGTNRYGHIYLEPKAPLEDRWYAIALADPPSEVNIPALSNLLVLTNGTRVARFRVGSQPMVASASWSNKKDSGVQTVSIGFSEAIKGDTSLVTLQTKDATPTSCKAQPIGASVSIGENSGFVPANEPIASAKSIQFICDKSFSLAQDIQLNIRPGLISVVGTQFGGGAEVRVSMRATEWIDAGADAKAWKPVQP